MSPPSPPPVNATIAPRPYQAEALDALHKYICAHDTNPCVVIPTGGGKSLLIAWAIERWKTEYPPFRVCILAHRKELIEQNAQELATIWPEADIGVYSAALNMRNEEASILFASIDSVYKKAGIFPPFDCLIIDEAHRIPARGEGKYRQFIKDCRITSKNLRVVGFTATPYRMGCGPICHKDHILHEVCYEANIGDLIRDGYLCRLRSKIGTQQPDLSQVKRNSGGDYVISSLSQATNKKDLISDTVKSAKSIIQEEKRKSTIFFCVDVEHCRIVSSELAKNGIISPVVTGGTPASERDQIARQFRAGHIPAICNVNVYTEGFNAKQVDCIVLLRPTLSAGLYVQMVGRGLRTHPSKTDCLVLDYAHCIPEHGPIDCMASGDVRICHCLECGDVFSFALRQCPNCGWSIPKQEVAKKEAEEAAEPERRMHKDKISGVNILGSEPEVLPVDSVTVRRHSKPGKPDSLRVTYHCGLTPVSEWICLDHPGFAGQNARDWWRRRGLPDWQTITVSQALEDMFLPQWIAKRTATITVQRDGKYYTIKKHGLNYD